jgi:pyruvate dehydrogenase E2 component (dihydrolipoamide acetyltransferase)
VALSSTGADPAGARAGSSNLKGETSVQEPTRAQRSIARRTAETRATVPDLELSADVQIDAALAFARDQEVPLGAVLVRACALALRAHPRANAAYRDGRFELYGRINVAVTLPTEDGFVTPTVLDADTKSPAAIAAELTELAGAAQSGTLTPPQMAGATFTLADLSGHAADRWSALISPPQAASLTAGAVRSVPVLRGGEVVAGHVIGLTLGCDHRILFGIEAGGFFATIRFRLEEARL